MYENKGKTVRPLLPEEAMELHKLLWKYNPYGPSKISRVNPKVLNGFKEIELPLTPIDGYARDEKLIEAWIMENAIDPSNMEAYTNIKETLGDFSFIANTIRSVYIKFMNVFGYVQEDDIKVYKIVETKTEKALSKHLDQLVRYMEWITEFLCGNDLTKVRGFLIAKEFAPEVLKSLEKLSKYENLVKLIQYSLDNGKLRLKTFKPEPNLPRFFK